MFASEKCLDEEKMGSFVSRINSFRRDGHKNQMIGFNLNDLPNTRTVSKL